MRERLVDNLEEKGMNERKAMQNVSKFGLVRGKGLVFLIEPQTGRQRKPKE